MCAEQSTSIGAPPTVSSPAPAPLRSRIWRCTGGKQPLSAGRARYVCTQRSRSYFRVILLTAFCNLGLRCFVVPLRDPQQLMSDVQRAADVSFSSVYPLLSDVKRLSNSRKQHTTEDNSRSDRKNKTSKSIDHYSKIILITHVMYISNTNLALICVKFPNKLVGFENYSLLPTRRLVADIVAFSLSTSSAGIVSDFKLSKI